MNAGEMVTKLRIAMGDDVEPYVVSSQAIFQWLSDAYLRIQLEYEQWKFLHSRKLIFNTVVDQPEYSVFNVKEISKDSVYYKAVSSDIRFPLYFLSYDEWVLKDRVNLQQHGSPYYFIALPNGNYRIDPVPTAVWEIWGDVWNHAIGFYSLNDEPIWDEKYHNLVVWEALKVALMEWPDDRRAKGMQANLVANLIPMRRAFNYEYLNAKGGAGPLL